MAATEVFPMTNPNSTCTAAALTWAEMRLSGLTTPTAAHFSGTDPTLKRNIGLIGGYDNDPTSQVAMMGFEVVKLQDKTTLSSQQIAELFKNNAPHVGIFWNSFHTMGYLYGHHDKEFFDNNVGLYKAKYTKDILAKMEEVRQGYNQEWSGYVIVRRKPRPKIVLPKSK